MAAAQRSKYAPDRVLVRFHPGLAAESRASAHAQLGAQVVRSYHSVPGLELVRIPPGLGVREAIRVYRNNPNVVYAEPDFTLHALETTPNDTSFSTLWAMKNTGVPFGTVDADIDATDAWDLSTGSSSIVVGVIDTGVYYNHADLVDNIYNNTAECSGVAGVDDDGNGYVDDCHGIDTANNDGNPDDDNDHGTHVSGTIGAKGNNSRGVVGVNWQVKILACKFLNSEGSGNTSDAIDCLDYMALMKDRGVNIVATNNSWGGGPFQQAMYDAIQAQMTRGILFVAAAGNDGTNNDTLASYPSNYYLPNVIGVAATDQFDALPRFSQYGRHTVHLGAPGVSILSTVTGPGDAYRTMDGTSMATPHVTGAAALLKAQNPALDWKAIKNRLLAGGDNTASLTDTITQKRLNVYGAMTCSNKVVKSRLRPVRDEFGAVLGTPVDLAMLHINCGAPNGGSNVSVSPTGETVALLDNGSGSDQVAGDGIYSGQWTPPGPGDYALSFANGDMVTVHVLHPYASSPTTYSYRTIAGTSLNLGDDFSGVVMPPFPIRFGGQNFTFAYISSNGTIAFDQFFQEYVNKALPYFNANTLVAPWWDDLSPQLDTAQNVFWDVTGSEPHREFVIEWRDVPHFKDPIATGETAKFQVVLFEDKDDILFNYADTVFGGTTSSFDQGASATVGVQVASSEATQFSYNAANLSDNTAILWQLEALPPQALAVTPSSGIGSSQTFSFLYSDGDGVGDLRLAYMMFNSTLTWAGSCGVYYDSALNSLYLVQDNGGGWFGPLAPGQVGTLQNSQCTLDTGASSVSGSGNNLTVNLALSFKPAFAGTKSIFMNARDRGGLLSGWQTRGSWNTSTPVAPTTVSVTPNAGSGASQTFALLYSDTNEAADIRLAYVLFHTQVSAASSCQAYYDSATNAVYLRNDAGTGFLGPRIIGQAGTVENSQCRLDAGASSVAKSGNNLTLNLAVSFKPAFVGTKNIYMYVTDREGMASGWQMRGSWSTSAPVAPQAVSVTPNAGAGSSRTFSLLYSDGNGVADLRLAYVMINSTLTWVGSCGMYYDNALNALYLIQDNGGGWFGPLTPGAVGTLTNSQCTLDAGASSVSKSGANLTLNLALSFKPAFAGNKSIFMNARDNGGLLSGWQTRGSWSTSAPVAPTTVSVTPSSGSGASQTFALLYSDTNGVGDLRLAYVLFHTQVSAASSCQAYYDNASNTLYLRNDAGAGFLGPLTVGQAGTLQNSQCTIDAGASSVVKSGNNLTLNLAVSFKPAFAGTKNIYMYVTDREGLASGWQMRGSWTAP